MSASSTPNSRPRDGRVTTDPPYPGKHPPGVGPDRGAALHAALNALVRLVLLLSLAAVGLALALARCVRAPSPAALPGVAIAPRQPIDGYFFRVGARHPRFFDLRTGREVAVRLPEEDRLFCASCSPWRDEQGQWQVAGRWIGHRATGPLDRVKASGLARYALPSGRVLDRVELDLTLQGPLCWFPEPPARVLLVDSRGRLCRYTFGAADDASPLRPVAWRVTPPGLGPVQIDDLTWPADPRLGRRIVVALAYLERVDGKPTLLPLQLWWLQLDTGARAIVAAGRLTVPAPEDRLRSPREEGHPMLANTPAGDLFVAYLVRHAGEGLWDLRVAPVAIDPSSGIPTAQAACGLTLAGCHLPTQPLVSPDGRWLFGVFGVEGRPNMPAHLRRFSVDAALAAIRAGATTPGD